MLNEEQTNWSLKIESECKWKNKKKNKSTITTGKITNYTFVN